MTTNTYTNDVTAFDAFHYEVGYDHDGVQDYRRIDEEPGEDLEITRTDNEIMCITFERNDEGEIDGFSFATWFEGENITSGGSALEGDETLDDIVKYLVNTIAEWLDETEVV